MNKRLLPLVTIAALLLTACSPSRPDGMTLAPGEKSKVKKEVSQYESVLREYQEKDEKADVDTYISLANAQERLSMFEEAEITLKKALELYPRYEVANHNLFIVYRNSGQYQKALEQLKTITDLPYNERYFKDEAELHLQIGNKKKAMEVYRKYVRISGQEDEFLEQRIKNAVVK